MYQNSSISSSRVYLTSLAAITAGFLLLLSLLSYLALRNGLTDFAFSDLYSYQLNKISTNDAVDVVFIGDSSLGNGVDAVRIAALTGKRAINLALTGAYGYGGTYNMLRRSLTRWRPALVVIMHTPDMMTRTASFDGFLYTALSTSDLFDVPPRALVATFANLDTIVSAGRRMLKAMTGAGRTSIENDYVRQGPPLVTTISSGGVLGGIPPASLNREQLYYLERISGLCKEANVNCVYAHGPWLDTLCEYSREYFSVAAEAISRTGLRIVPNTPVCFPRQQMGDANDHVHPATKSSATEAYLSRLVRAGLPDAAPGAPRSQ